MFYPTWSFADSHLTIHLMYMTASFYLFILLGVIWFNTYGLCIDMSFFSISFFMCASSVNVHVKPIWYTWYYQYNQLEVEHGSFTPVISLVPIWWMWKGDFWLPFIPSKLAEKKNFRTFISLNWCARRYL